MKSPGLTSNRAIMTSNWLALKLRARTAGLGFSNQERILSAMELSVKRSLLLILLTLSLLVNPAIFAGQGHSQPQRQATAPSQGAAVALAPQPQAQLANHILP